MSCQARVWRSLVDLADSSDKDNEKVGIDSVQAKKQEVQKDIARDSSNLRAPKASFVSFDADEGEFTPASMFQGLIIFAKKQMLLLLLGAGATYYTNRASKGPRLLEHSDGIMTTMEEVSSNAKPVIQQLQRIPKELMKLIEKLPHQEINQEEASLFGQVLYLCLYSRKFPGELS